MLTFGVSGKLILNSLVMYDHQTDTLWSQFLAEAVQGPLAGTKLEFLASQLTTWGAWKEQHPDTLALDKGDASSLDSYRFYYEDSRQGIRGELEYDPRLPSKDLVLGLGHGAVWKAYPFRYLEESPVLNDEVDGLGVVVTFNAESATALVYDSALDGEGLTFEQAGEPLLMRDLETGSTWLKGTGEATAGPMSGRRLDQLPAFPSFWFAWKDFHPDTLLFELVESAPVD